MAGYNGDNISTAKTRATGMIFIAPIGTAVPTDASTALDKAFKSLGYISEDGLTNSVEVETLDVKEAGGSTAASIIISRDEKYSFTALETNSDVLKVAYGEDNVKVGADGAISVTHNMADSDEYVYVAEVLLRGNKVLRKVIPRGKRTELGDVVYKSGEAISYEITIAALLDSANATAYTYIADIEE
jgi:hypothetical protein